MIDKTSSSQFQLGSYGTLGDWAYSGVVAQQRAKQRRTDQTVPYDEPVHLQFHSSDRATNNEIAALAAYTKAVMTVFLEWRAACNALSNRMSNRVGEAELKRQLDQLDSVLGHADTLLAPDRAAAIQRLFLAMLRSGRGYYQSFFNGADEDLTRQYARDYLEQGTLFLAEFDRMLRVVGQVFKDPRDLG